MVIAHIGVNVEPHGRVRSKLAFKGSIAPVTLDQLGSLDKTSLDFFREGTFAAAELIGERLRNRREPPASPTQRVPCLLATSPRY